ncbi:MAG TPA: YcgL domain-containing protein [Candidatus Kapabacteria bacterium]|nr:YcgL domain-containing protein [Candidatus Kapabacteria bacterium]
MSTEHRQSGDSVLCAVYRSPKKEGMYLYVPKTENPFEQVPEPLLQRFGEPSWVLDLELTASRKLARVSAADVIKGLRDLGFYLQMPPGDLPREI